MDEMKQNAEKASAFLKSLASPHRLLVLCALASGEKSVSELTEIAEISQSSMSQHLAKLRAEDVVDFRREHRQCYYYICNPHVARIIGVLHDAFCPDK